MVSNERIKGNRHKPEHGKFHQNVRKASFFLKVTEHCNRLPRKVVNSILEVLKTHLTLSSAIYSREPALAGGSD